MISVRLTTGHLEAAGAALIGAGRYGLAADFYRAAISAAPTDPCLYTGLSGALRLLGQLPEAEAAILEAIAIDRTAKRLVALACTVRDRGRKDDCEDFLRDALALDPDCADAAGCLGTWLLDRWRETSGPDTILGEAAGYLERAVALAPHNHSFQEARLIVLQCSDRHDEWKTAVYALIKDYPDVFQYRMQEAFALLKTGDFAHGFPAVAATIYKRPAVADCPIFRFPRWAPVDEPGPVVVWNPEGAGDQFQFARFYALAAEHGADVRVIANEPEARLLARCPGVSAIVNPDNDFDCEKHATIYSLAAAFITDETDIPTAPYLSADDETIRKWETRLAPIPGFRVGVAWRGNPKQDNDARRSFTVDQFAPLAQIPGVNLISLQKGHREDLVDTDIWDLGEYYQGGDWLETAAVIANLDLVIAPCTGVAHLAGAMGKPVWLALSEPGCWRWLIGREDSPWYPTMQIFRQSTRGSWDGVFERMAMALEQLGIEQALSA